MAPSPPPDLLDVFAKGRALLVCGAGVSRVATENAAPGWKQLIEDGIEHALRKCAPDKRSWEPGCRAHLTSVDASNWLYAADIVQDQLGGFDDAKYRAFFIKQLGGLKNVAPAIAKAIADLAAGGNRIATTNYDQLISKALGWDRVIWLHPEEVMLALRDQRPAVWHIHGDFDHPESVVFSNNDYKRIGGSKLAQFLQQLAALNFSLVFVGCSLSGLADENVGALLTWLNENFGGLNDRHYVLVAEGNTDTWPVGVTPVPFGSYNDLPAFLRSLAPAPPSQFPPNPKMIGRVGQLAALVNALLTQARPVIVPGALGMGKTTLALAAGHAAAVVAKFGIARRFFINLEPVPNADGILRQVAHSLGLDAAGSIPTLLAAIRSDCAVPALVILDNLETPWRADDKATEAVLAQLADIAGLALVLTVRGEAPHVAGGVHKLADVKQLALDEARDLFLRHAGPHYADDPALPGLLAALDGHPLSIELMAGQADGRPDLASLADDWQRGKAVMLTRGAADDRLTSLRVSLDISRAALGFDSAADRLLRLIALLPGGLAVANSDIILPGAGSTAGRVLETARLAHRRGERWHLLAPVREIVDEALPPMADDQCRLISHGLALAADGFKIGTATWPDVEAGVTAEAANFDAFIALAAKATPVPALLGPAFLGLGQFHSFTGLGSLHALPAALKSLHEAGDVLGEANCIFGLGKIAQGRSDHIEAKARFEAALTLYHQKKNLLGEANCIKSLGDVALAQSMHAEAQARFKVALPLYRQIEVVLGEAHCIFGLAEIELRQSDDVKAWYCLDAALTLYRQVKDIQGEANCIKSFGEIALEHSDFAQAQACNEAARSLYHQVGDVGGEANCILGLGNAMAMQSDHAGALAQFEAALPLFLKVRDVPGLANCFVSIGGIAEVTDNKNMAILKWREALALYAQIPEPFSIGHTYCRLARVAATSAEAASHRAAARAAWASIDRADLIAKHLDCA